MRPLHCRMFIIKELEMGFWDKVKKAAISAKCLTGWHGGRYTPIAGKPQCNVEKTCPDCNEHITDIKHKFNDWQFVRTTSSHRCDSFRNCIHCGAEEIKRIHTFEERGKDSDCRVIEKCSNCFEERKGRTEHKWVHIMGHEIRVQGKRKCFDCGATEK